MNSNGVGLWLLTLLGMYHLGRWYGTKLEGWQRTSKDPNLDPWFKSNSEIGLVVFKYVIPGLIFLLIAGSMVPPK